MLLHELQICDAVQRKHSSDPRLRAQIGRVVAIYRSHPNYGGQIVRVKVRFPATWPRFGGGTGDSVQTFKVANIVRVLEE